MRLHIVAHLQSHLRANCCVETTYILLQHRKMNFRLRTSIVDKHHAFVSFVEGSIFLLNPNILVKLFISVVQRWSELSRKYEEMSFSTL
ncbi:unnamed protein product [Allacma fusca]|uniref:Uncharacterized protein n=1 Tax=Allacma fusca TaxID=39272 RepID=A0A8J2LM14_9HEXA|nr:unnamed protein product [Allacma fusca]